MPTLREDTVRGYLEGTVSAAELDAEASASLTREPSGNATIVRHQISDMATDYTITLPHIVRLVDDIIAAQIGLPALDAVAFCLEASSRFTWSDDPPDADRIPEALFWLGTPEVNEPLTPRFLARVRQYLLTGLSPFDSKPPGP